MLVTVKQKMEAKIAKYREQHLSVDDCIISASGFCQCRQDDRVMMHQGDPDGPIQTISWNRSQRLPEAIDRIWIDMPAVLFVGSLLDIEAGVDLGNEESVRVNLIDDARQLECVSGPAVVSLNALVEVAVGKPSTSCVCFIINRIVVSRNDERRVAGER